MKQSTLLPSDGKKISPARLKQLAISDTGFIFDSQTGQSFTVNKTGLAALLMLKDNATAEATARDLAERCNQPYELVLCCVETFIMQLSRYL